MNFFSWWHHLLLITFIKSSLLFLIYFIFMYFFKLTLLFISLSIKFYNFHFMRCYRNSQIFFYFLSWCFRFSYNVYLLKLLFLHLYSSMKMVRFFFCIIFIVGKIFLFWNRSYQGRVNHSNKLFSIIVWIIFIRALRVIFTERFLFIKWAIIKWS